MFNLDMSVDAPAVVLDGQRWYRIWDGFRNKWRLSDGNVVTGPCSTVKVCADQVRAGILLPLSWPGLVTEMWCQQ